MIGRAFKDNIFNLRFLFGILLSLYFVWFLSKDFNIDNFYTILFNINLLYILIAVIILIISVFFRALRWHILFDDKIKINVKSLFDMQLIGYFGNNILPLRLGEILKAYLLGNKFNISKSQVFGTIILERFLDFFGAFSFLLFFIFFSSNNYFLNQTYYIVIAIFILLILLCSYLIKNFKFNYSHNNFIIKSVNNLILGFGSLNKQNFIFTFIYSIIIWMCYVLMVYYVQLSIPLQLNIFDSILILLISTLWLAIPSAPAGIGTFEMGVGTALGLLGISKNVLEFSIILHSITFFPYTILGGYFFLKFYFNENKKI